ncbi:MAG: hypothetical protein GY909_09245 [Oligoflexia bacterium]|nr:hypothetical protein [Oligoflexia bacterium]
MIYKLFFVTLFLNFAGCSSGKIIPTTDVCTIKKHWKDNVFQVLINEKPINTRWYIHQEAKDITSMLADDNKCMPYLPAGS